MPKTDEGDKRFQFVWWGLNLWGWEFGFRRYGGAWEMIYRWSCQIGPVEVRRWETDPLPILKRGKDSCYD